MLHKKCMTMKNCFIISEQNNGRDSANIIDKNSSLSVKYYDLSHIHSSISNKFNQLQQSANDSIRRNSKSSNNRWYQDRFKW